MLNFKKNLFVIFFRGTGGQHLTNLIALSDQFYREVDYSKYNYVDPKGEINAHFHTRSVNSNNQFLSTSIVEPFSSELKSNIFPLHAFNYFSYKQVLESYPNKNFLVIQLPSYGSKSLAFNRLCKLNSWKNDTTWINNAYWDLDYFYKQEHLEKLIPGTWNTIDSELLFSSNIDQLIQDIEKKLDIKILNHPLARSIHQKWLTQLTLNLN